ncbi:MAG TPA: metallopeptidase TldD-related protein [Bacteroidales bacterium]
MKTFIKYILIPVLFVSIFHLGLKAQVSGDEIIFKAMNDELNRNITDLKLDKYKPPFFMSYHFYDANSLYMRATLGAIRYTYEGPSRNPYVRLMIGDYSLNDENFVSGTQGYQSESRSYLQLPLDNNYTSIRRSFWIMTDQVYKSALEKYEQKLTALKQQNKEEEEKLDDYSKITPVSVILKEVPFKYDKTQWENTIKDLSGVFKKYGQINGSSVNLTFGKAMAYVITNEGTKLKIPLSIASILVYANTQAEDGDQMNDQLSYYALTPDQLPSVDKIKQDIVQMADNLTALRKAPLMNDAYSGPVIFEGSAVADLCAQKLFRSNGLIASREPVYAVERPSQGNINKLDNKVNQKICSENITIKATPKVKSFNNMPLIGSFEIDAEGVAPKDELILVDKGILKTLLNDRVPTPKVKESNGYCRFGLRGSSITTQKAPGVINIAYENGESLKSLRKSVLKEAEKNGLGYIYVIRKLESNIPRNLPVSKPYAIYKVSVKTGEEQLIRSATISEFQTSAFKQIINGTKEQNAYNSLLNNSVPVSFIVPQAIAFSDINIEKDKTTKPKLPLVSNPVLAGN